MQPRSPLRIALAAAAVLCAGAVHAADTSTEYKAPRTSFGQPDLQGVWTNASLTSLQRPAMFKSLTLTEQEAVALEKRRAAMRAAQDKPSDPNAGAPPSGSDPGGYNASWTDPGVAMGRTGCQVLTSWIVFPANVHLPYSLSSKKHSDETLA